MKVNSHQAELVMDTTKTPSATKVTRVIHVAPNTVSSTSSQSITYDQAADVFVVKVLDTSKPGLDKVVTQYPAALMIALATEIGLKMKGNIIDAIA